MDIINDWDTIRQHFNKSFSSNFHITIASVDVEGNPTATPIGSLFLNDNQTGFYFEKFPTKLREHADTHPNVCLLGVNSGTLFWLKSLFNVRFSSHPAIKLYGVLGARRKATDKEINRLNRRMKFTNGLGGNTYLWKKMDYVREIKFVRATKINLGEMTNHL